jgi:hypothetical protein
MIADKAKKTPKAIFQPAAHQKIAQATGRRIQNIQTSKKN